jgi:hypothetical protein
MYEIITITTLHNDTSTRTRENLKKKNIHYFSLHSLASIRYPTGGELRTATTFIHSRPYTFTHPLSIFRYSVSRSSEAATATATTDSYIRTYDGRIIISAAFIPLYIYTVDTTQKTRIYYALSRLRLFITHTHTHIKAINTVKPNRMTP